VWSLGDLGDRGTHTIISTGNMTTLSPTKSIGEVMSGTLPGLGSFYMAGQWVRFGGGVPGAVTSGRHLMQILCKKGKKRFVTTTP
jgi:hypothetical protein